MLINPDASLYWINLEKAVSFINGKLDASVIGMALTNPNGQLEKWGHSLKFPTLKYIGRKRFSEPSLADEATPVAWVSGGAMIIRFSWWQKLKGLDPGFFFYFEDVDFCHRIKDRGGKVYFLPQAVVNHRRGGSNISIYRRKMHYYASEARYFHIYHSPSDYLLLRLIRFPYKLFYFARCYLIPSYWVYKFKSAKEFVVTERRDGFPKFYSFWNRYLSIPLVKKLWLLSGIVNLIILGESIWGRVYLSSPLILHYNAYLGIDYYGDTTSLLTFPLIAFLMSLFNFILSIILFLSKRYLPFVSIPSGASLAFQLTILGALLNLLIINS
jgi:GT2 family glycosyltransferase